MGSKEAYEKADYWQNFKTIVECIDGDVNVDEDVDVLDVVDIARYVVGTPAESFVEVLADINRDGTVNLGDAVTLVNDIAGDQNLARASRVPRRKQANDILDIVQGDTGVTLTLKNERSYVAFQFDLYLPVGTGIEQIALNKERTQGHQLLYNEIEDGHYRIAALSMSNCTFTGNEDELLEFSLDTVSETEVKIRNAVFFDATGNEYLFDDAISSISTGNMTLPIVPSKVRSEAYDLQGRRVKTDMQKKGVFIVNGKKMIVK